MFSDCRLAVLVQKQSNSLEQLKLFAISEN